MHITKRATGNVKKIRHLAWPYAWAIVFFLIGLNLGITLVPINAGLIFNVFLPGVIASFYLLGFKPGLLTVLLSALSSNYLFSPPYNAFSLDANAIIGLFFFIFTSLLIQYFIHTQSLNEQRYQNLLEDQSDLISRFKPNNTFTYANPAYLNLFGIDKNSVMSHQWQPQVFEEDIAMVNEKLKRISYENPVVVIENRVYDSARNIRWFEFINHGIFNAEEKLVEIQSVGREITSFKQQQDELDFLAHHDSLTGLPNRLLLNDRLKLAIAKAKRKHTTVAICFLDLDFFKRINDQYGHNAGDEVLITVSQRLLSIFRETDTVSRIGGDEFMMVIDNYTSNKGHVVILERMLAKLHQPITLSNGVVVEVSASVGVSQYNIDGEDLQELIRLADERMYQAKATGRRKIVEN